MDQRKCPKCGSLSVAVMVPIFVGANTCMPTDDEFPGFDAKDPAQCANCDWCGDFQDLEWTNE